MKLYDISTSEEEYKESNLDVFLFRSFMSIEDVSKRHLTTMKKIVKKLRREESGISVESLDIIAGHYEYVNEDFGYKPKSEMIPKKALFRNKDTALRATKKLADNLDELITLANKALK